VASIVKLIVIYSSSQILLRILFTIKQLQSHKVIRLSQNANDQGRFVRVKTRLTIKRKKECEGRGDYIHVARG
jgi:hypothetical protein